MKREGMDMEKKNKKFTRREFIKKVGQGTAAVGVASVLPRLAKPVRAAKRDHVLVGYVNPSTGHCGLWGAVTLDR